MDRRGSRLSRRQLVQAAGVAGVGIVAGCGRLPWQAPAAVQEPAAPVRLGWLNPFGSEGVTSSVRVAFLGRLRELGYEEGKNLTVEYRAAESHEDRLPALAGELVRIPVDVIFTQSSPATLAAKGATSPIPIVFTDVADPVGVGLVASLAHPGGNATGLTNIRTQLAAKQLELLTVAAPRATRVGVLWHGGNPANEAAWRNARDAAQVLGIEALSLEVQAASELESAFATVLREQATALLVISDPLIVSQSAAIVDFAAQNRLPAIYAARSFVDRGGLMNYGPSNLPARRRAAEYVDRILRGAKPADLPVEQPMTFEFVVNMKTVRELGITFPNEIMLQVTEVLP